MSTENKTNRHYINYPNERRRFPKPSAFNKGDRVRALIGPATGRVGAVVVELNRNYLDFERRIPVNSVGVIFAEPVDLIPALKEIVEKESDHEALMSLAVRWFTNPNQLELVAKSSENP